MEDIFLLITVTQHHTTQENNTIHEVILIIND